MKQLQPKRPDTKKCCGCGEILPRDTKFFYNSTKGWSSRCKPCHNAYSIAWAKRNPSRVKKISRGVKLRKKYGISQEQYDVMAAQQDNRCFLCEKEHKRRQLNVDHCHTTRKVRRLVCDRCNLALGLIKDDASLARRIAGYLDAHN